MKPKRGIQTAVSINCIRVKPENNNADNSRDVLQRNPFGAAPTR
jgi:hypothetical protein